MKKEDLLLDENGNYVTKKGYVVNPLTVQPGGVTLLFAFSDGSRETHPRIKFPKAYVNKVVTESLLQQRQVIDVYDYPSMVSCYDKRTMAYKKALL